MREALILTPLPAIKAAPFPSPSRGGLGRGGKGLGVRFFALYFTQLRTAITEDCRKLQEELERGSEEKPE
jgi:hypothetical protein